MKSTINFNHKPDYLLQHDLFNHQDDLFEYYSKLLMLRIDFAYRKESESFEYADTYQITADMISLIEQIKDISSIVGFAWVLEYGEKHRFHIHAAFYINGQCHQKVWRFWEDIRYIWEEVTEGEGYAHHCEPKPYYRVRGERVIKHTDEKKRSGMKYILSYLGKDSQRTERRIYQLSDIPTAKKIGRKRNKK
ncbi:inovirus-type Gp2 protein [Providencia rettgeri]|uniref:inovirus-type Gp2 protein n=1 Tax=Providencia rettgeri TaxID=587 RepID=UPI0018C6FE1A|nr:inovirus-type Gp2 protein [Providencia rettgeri]MBG5921936.1 inovirus-type Gp2 protein [Providencia rettgeri]HEM8210629.1 inovirus-type Gp2 protein [Providencia rettgeri]